MYVVCMCELFDRFDYYSAVPINIGKRETSRFYTINTVPVFVNIRIGINFREFKTNPIPRVRINILILYICEFKSMYILCF